MKDILVKVNEEQLSAGAKMGWVFPLNLPYGEYKKTVYALETSPEELDEYFLDYFLSDFDENVKKPIRKYLDGMPRYLVSLVNECFSAFENGHYQICVPALFSVLEGILIELSNGGDRVVIRYKQGLDNLIANESIEIEVLPLISISKFIEYSFCKSDFNNIENMTLNRHWSQHGRYLHDLTSKAPLQLFNAVSLVLFTKQFMDKKS